MFERLAELIAESWEKLSPWTVIAEYERGIVLRLGKYHRPLPPGLRWKAPFIDDVHSTDTTVNTLSLSTQSLVASDDTPVSVASVITYRVRNPKKYLLKMGDQEESLADIGMGVVKQVVRDHGCGHISDVDDILQRKLQEKAGRFGFAILEFKLVQVSRAKVIRLMQE